MISKTLISLGITDWIYAKAHDSSISYYDRDTSEMECKVRNWLHVKQFGCTWGEEGLFENLDGLPMDVNWER